MEVLLFNNLCRNVPYFYDTFMWPFLAPVSPLISRFPLIMVVSGFGPYHCQQSDDAPAKCAGITPTPWAIMPTLGFVSYCRGHELLVTPPPPQRICRFCFLGEKILHETMNMLLYYELQLLTPLLTPHTPPPFSDVSDDASLPVFMAWVIVIANTR
jgi:hypothetical protein